MLDAAVAQAHRYGSIAALAGAKCFRALGWYWRGFLAEVEADARDLVHAVETARMTQGRPYAGAYLADPLMEQGRLDEAQAALDWACPADHVPPSGHWFVLVDSRARLLVLQGRAEEALEVALDQGRRIEAAAGHNPASGGWRSNAALALLALDRRVQARRLVAEEVALAQRWGAPRALGRALRVAELAAAGQTNRYIAQALFVTTKTVEVHLSSAYRKLDVPGRANLAKVLGLTAGQLASARS